MNRTLATIGRATDTSIRRAREQLEDAVLRAHESGASQRAIGAELTRSQPEVARLLARARSRHARRWLTAAEHGEAIDREVSRRDEDFALRLVRQMVESLLARTPDEQAVFLADRPIIDDERWDTLARAALGWACRTIEVTPPAWTRPKALRAFWFVRPEPAMRARLFQETPSELAIVGIWLDQASLRGL